MFSKTVLNYVKMAQRKINYEKENNMKKLFCVIMAILMLATVFVSCSKDGASGNNDEGTLSITGNDKYSDLPNIPVTNYEVDFNVLYYESDMYEKYYFAEGVTGVPISDANYDRQLKIKEHLGVDIKALPGGTLGELLNKVSTASMSGDDSYQMVLTHCFNGVLGMALGDYLLDYKEMPYVNLDAEWWNKSQMEQVAIEGKLYLGTNSFIFHKPNVILFNKDIAEQYPDVGSELLYEHVENKTWTMENLKLYASRVSNTSNDSSAPELGTYGFTSQLDFELCSFMAANNYYTTDVDSEGNYTLKNVNETLIDIFEEVTNLMEKDYSFGWKYGTSEEKCVKIDTGRTFFSTAALDACINYTIEKKVIVGILPYPTIEEGEDYRSLDWAGFVVIPSSIRNKELSGAVAELLAYYGEKDLKSEFYDVLLGSRTAESLKDSQMLDLIFDNLVCDPGLNFLNTGSGDMSFIFYTIPRLINRGSTDISSYFGTYYRSAKNQLNFDLY